MHDVERDVYQWLKAQKIDCQILAHAPAHTMEDCLFSEKSLDAVMPKNLFLTPRNRSAFYLLVVRPHAEFRTADVSRQIGSSRLSFADADSLMQLLRTHPGAISPMGLLFDRDRRVKLLVDRTLCDTKRLAFHPCVNTASFAVPTEDFFGRILPGLGRVPTFVDIHSEDS